MVRIRSKVRSMKFLSLFTAVSLGVLSPGAPAQPQVDAAAEAMADRILANPHQTHGDWRGTIQNGVEFIREYPEHPLCELAFHFLEQRAASPEDPNFLLQAIGSLDPELPLGPAARRAFVRLRSELKASYGDLSRVDDTLFEGYLRSFRVLGPLAPHFHAQPASLTPEALANPGFEDEHRGLLGSIRWRNLDRSNFTERVRPWRAVREDTGLAVLAASFTVDGGGAAWIEVEAHHPGRSMAGGASFPGVVPGYSLCLNGGDVHRVEALHKATPRVERIPVALSPGVNHILIASTLVSSGRAEFSLRVLDADGFPRSDLRSSSSTEAAGSPVGTPPEGPFPTAENFLRGLPERGAATEGLLGILLFFDQRESEGLDRIRRAHLMAPERQDLATYLVLATASSHEMPEAWRRGEARRLAEELVSAHPGHLEIGLYLANEASLEDREESALERIRLLEAEHPNAARLFLAKAGVYQRLGMDVAMDAALAEASRLEPTHPQTLQFLGQRAEEQDLLSMATQHHLRAVRTGGSGAGELQQLADLYLRLGERETALELHREAALRSQTDPIPLVDALISLEEWDEAKALLGDILAEFPEHQLAHQRLARIAIRSGNEDAALVHLDAAIERVPLDWGMREMRMDFGQPDEVQEFFDAQRLDVLATIAEYDDQGRRESIVSVIDHVALWVHGDGSLERMTQNLYQVRDLAGCNALGTRPIQGEALEIATIKAGTLERREPILVNGQYVLPSLEPGDFVEETFRSREGRRVDGLVRPGGWFFASTDKAFELSRYAVSMPSDSGLQLETRNLGDAVEHSASTADSGRVTHVYRSRSQAQVLAEAGAPPQNWYLPHLELGMNDGLDRMASYAQAEARWAARVTPALERTARDVIDGIEDPVDQARALHVFVQESLTGLSWNPQSAVQTLMGREGNSTFLYMALLQAVGIPNELVWARNFSPSGDPDPDPLFTDIDRWRQRPLVRVEPIPGESIWCDMTVRLLPFGVPTWIAPGASALASEQGVELNLPTVGLEDRPALHLEGTFAIDAAGNAEIQASCRFPGFVAWSVEEQVRTLPEAQRQAALRQTASQVIPRFELRDHELPGLGDPLVPLSIEVSGRVRRFLDLQGEAWQCNQPIPRLQMRASFAGERTRRLPFFFPEAMIRTDRARFVLPEGLSWDAEFEDVELECAGGTYRMTARESDDGSWVLEREVRIRAFSVDADGFASFVEFCDQVDAAERRRLRFLKP